MRKSLGLLALSAILLSSCETLTKTASTADVSSSLQSTTVADLKVEDRISYTMSPSKDIRRGGMKNVKRAAESEALEAYARKNNAKLPDLLVEPEYVVEQVSYGLFGKKVSSITVTGRPAYYTNFRSLNDSVWCNPAFRGLKATARYSAPKAGKVRKTAYAAGQADYDMRRTGLTWMLNLNGGYYEAEADDNDGGGTSGDVYYGVSLGVGYQITPHWYVGIGIGANFLPDDFDGAFMPLYAQGRYYFSKKKHSLFIDCKVGGSFGAGLDFPDAYDCDMEAGVYVSPSIGYSFGSFELALQYIGQAYSLEPYYGYESKYDYTLNQVGLSLGFKF